MRYTDQVKGDTRIMLLVIERACRYGLTLYEAGDKEADEYGEPTQRAVARLRQRFASFRSGSRLPRVSWRKAGMG
jgi:hypothetical protein